MKAILMKSPAEFPVGVFILYTKSSYNVLANVRHHQPLGSHGVDQIARTGLDYNVYSWRFMRAAATYK